MKTKTLSLIALTAGAVFLLTGCLPGDGTSSPASPAGLLWGIWHGWIAPVSLIFSLFRDPIRIYEVHNTGFWYDLAFYGAIIGGFGGLQFSRKKHKRRGKED